MTLPLDEKILALAIAGGHAEVGFACLARTVDDAAHDGHSDRRGHVLQAFGDGGGERDHIHLGAAAARAGDDVEPCGGAILYSRSLHPPYLDLFFWPAAERDTRIVANAPAWSAPNARQDLMVPSPGGPAPGNAEVQRPIALDEQSVRF